MTQTSTFPAPQMLSVKGGSLEVFEAGTENTGNPIVLCHGWPEHAYAWRHQIPALVAAGYHVIVPNQRGFGNSSRPTTVTDYDIAALTGDLVGLLDHFGYDDATFIGHDWGANIVWSLSLLHPSRVRKIINLALPYQARTEVPWIEFMEAIFGSDNYFVHFNRQPGVADDILDLNTEQFLRNLFRKNLPPVPPASGMMMINLAEAKAPHGDPIMSDDDLSVFVEAFEMSGFTGGINWYRNLDRNWHILANIDPIVKAPALMIYGEHDMIPQSETLPHFVPSVDVESLACGHWIQQEMPDETNALILNWLSK
ncbi:MAG: alpha/beta hydrolase [Cognatishimia sp.]|uniref:alpha/beta fold hydrolase n=1 Tax=Cognatishimia sp. TaxID=2211648 RepID=UPI003B8DD448